MSDEERDYLENEKVSDLVALLEMRIDSLKRYESCIDEIMLQEEDIKRIKGFMKWLWEDNLYYILQDLIYIKEELSEEEKKINRRKKQL